MSSRTMFTSIVLAILLVVVVILANSCTHFKVIRHGFPDTNDYKIFYNDTIRKGNIEIPIPEALTLKPQIDTIKLKNPQTNQLIPLSEYLEKTKTQAFLIIQNDTLIYERYFNGYSRSTIHCTFSVTKSITSILAGVALAEYPELTLNEPITKYIPELGEKHPLFNQLNLKNLFEMKSGLSYSNFNNLTDIFCDNNMIYYTQNQKEYILNSKFRYPPGQFRQYKTYDPLLVAWTIEQVSQKKLQTIFRIKYGKK